MHTYGLYVCTVLNAQMPKKELNEKNQGKSRKINSGKCKNANAEKRITH